uniref:Rap guanine nucleotide exchange factor 4 n=2 Tax=Cacopsylla melanoneura TaxID=428564 RepID=A0A8D9DTX0_9HEMI
MANFTEWIIAIDKRPIDRNVKDVELIAARLRRLDTFNRLPPSLLRDIANVAYYEDLERGVTILNQNDSGSSWYIVLGGSLEVRLITTSTQNAQNNTIEKTIITLTFLGVGATFTEAILGDVPRGAHIITKTTCELLRIQHRDFVDIKEKNKDIITELQMITKIKNGFEPTISKTSPPMPSQARRTSTPDCPNPAEPIVESPSVPMARAGWVLRTLLLNDESGTLRDRKTSGGRTIARRCASGSELVDWLMGLSPSLAPTRQIATGMWQALLEEGVIYHVNGEQAFRDKCILYNFWQDKEGSCSTATAQDIAEAEEHLEEALLALTRRAPDAILRYILRKQPLDRTSEDLEQIYEELLHLKPLHHLSNSVRRELAGVVMFEAHPRKTEILFHQGDEGKSWYIIIQGSVDVVIYGKGCVTSLYAGEDFGKLALVNNAPRAATIVTREDNCHFLRVDKDDFIRIMRDVEANTVRLKEHGKDVLVLERMVNCSSHQKFFQYMVIAGTPLKSLEYLLETRVSTGGLGGGTMDIDPCLEDFFLTHVVFMPTKTLVSELNKHFHMDSSNHDKDFILSCKRSVVQFVFRWVSVIRHVVFDDTGTMNFIQDLASEVESDSTMWSGLTEEASLMHHVMTHMKRYQDERTASAGQKWKLPPSGQPISLFSGPVDSRMRTMIRPSDDIIFRVYCADHTYCTLRFPVNATAEQIKTSAAEKLGLLVNPSDLLLVEVKSTGERVVFRDNDLSIPTGLTLNGRIFVSPKDHLDALTCISEQETYTEGMDFDLESFSAKELAFHMTLFDWDLFWSIHEYELVYHVVGRYRFQQITANLDVFLRRFNEIQYWVITEILLVTSLNKRVQILRKMIKLAAYCKEYRNINALFAVLMGLSNVAISRLSLTWDKLPSKSKKIYTELEALIDPSKNHRAYRQAVSKLQSPVIPFMPLLLKDMVFTHEGNKTVVDGLVNFEKMHMLAQTLRTLRYCRTRHLVLDPPTPKAESEVKSYVSCLRTINNQRILTSMSQKLEPRRS